MIQHQPLTPDAFPEEIKAFLGTIHGLAYPRQGYTSDLAIVSGERGTYVVKRSPGEQYSQWLAQEYRVLQALRGLPLPLPQPYQFLQQRRAATPESWLVMSYLPGKSLKMLAQNEPDQTAKRRMLHTVGQTLAVLHQQPVPAALRHASQGSWLACMLKRARYHWQHYKTDGNAGLLAHLEKHRPAPVPPALIHGDFTVDNVLLLDGKVSGIIDWALGAYGDPRYDLALAIRPKAGIFDTPEDVQAFLDGYGTSGLSQQEYDYFIGLYEFF
jgi:aminoglycoside phosphotransferase (APT) family kinase protein